MGTRSTIAMKKPEGGVVAIYCHWDGYPAHNGVILNKHWTDTDKIAQLIGLGDLSSLGTELGEKQDFDNRETQSDGWCLANPSSSSGGRSAPPAARRPRCGGRAEPGSVRHPQ